MNFYNEIEPYCVDWLGNLIEENVISRGEICDISIKNVDPRDVTNKKRCHFFAGLGLWDYALTQAGWPDDWQVWTGSCPCQPFSQAGTGEAFADPRHLWPDFYRLIAAERPFAILGEQVDGRDGLAWLDLVQTDLENSGYTFGAVISPAAGIGAPQRRHRIYWMAHAVRTGRPERPSGAGDRSLAGQRDAHSVAHAAGTRYERALQGAKGEARDEARLFMSGTDSRSHSMAHADRVERQRRFAEPVRSEFSTLAGSIIACQLGNTLCASRRRDARSRNIAETQSGGARCPNGDGGNRSSETGNVRQLAHANGGGSSARQRDNPPMGYGHAVATDRGASGPGPVNGFWRDADWLGCTDGKFRAAEPGTFPLAYGHPDRVGKLRAYGNAICVPQAVEFVKAAIEAIRS